MDEMNIDGDENIQIHAKGDVIHAYGEGAMAAKGNIYIHQGIDPKEYAQLLAEKQILEAKLAQMNEESNEYQREQIAIEATKLAEEMQNNKNIEFDAWKLNEIGMAACLAGQLERAEGNFKQALRKFMLNNDRRGELYTDQPRKHRRNTRRS